MASVYSATGNLTRDPVLRGNEGNQFYSFSVGVRTRDKDAQGNYKSIFVDCTINQRIGAFFGERAKKGNRVFITGELSTREYKDKNNVDRTAITLRCNTAELLERPAQNEGNSAPAAKPEPQPVENDNDLPF